MSLWRFVAANIIPPLKEIRARVAVSVVLLFLTTFLYVIAIESGRAILKNIRVLITGRNEPNFVVDAVHGLGIRFSDNALMESGIITLIAFTLSYSFIYFRDFIFETVAERVVHFLRHRFFSHVIRLPYLTFIRYNPGMLAKRLFIDSSHIRMLVMEIGLLRIADVILITGLFVYLTVLHVYLSLIAFAFLVLYFFVSMATSTLAQKGLKRTDRTYEKAQSYSVEAFTNLVGIRANCREKAESEKFRTLSLEHERTTVSLSRALTFDKILTNYLASIGPILVLFVGGFFILNHTMSYETLIIFSIVLGILIAPINNITLIPMRIQRILVAMDNMTSFMNMRREGEGRVSGAALDENAVPYGSALVSFKDVRFSYENSNRTVGIDDLTINRGEFIAFLSPSGYGKTTIMRLLFGMLEGYEGQIRICGTDIREVGLEELRRLISYLPQENYVFSGTVLENLLYGAKDSGQVEDGKIEDSLRKVRLYDDVMKMPEGLDTNIEYMGHNLSGGQMRRLCLARVLMKDPGILVLDEPFFGLPFEDQQIIINTLKNELSNITIILITHQANFAVYADRVVVLEPAEMTAGRGETPPPGTSPVEEIIAVEKPV